jgi:hypothetical protein
VAAARYYAVEGTAQRHQGGGACRGVSLIDVDIALKSAGRRRRIPERVYISKYAGLVGMTRRRDAMSPAADDGVVAAG